MRDAATGAPTVAVVEAGALVEAPGVNTEPAAGLRGQTLPKTRHIPERSCIACGRKLPKRDLIRIVRDAQGQVRVDPTGKSNGRGSYLCAAAQCWERGIRKGGVERGLRSPVSSQDRQLLFDYYRQHLAGLTPGEE